MTRRPSLRLPTTLLVLFSFFAPPAAVRAGSGGTPPAVPRSPHNVSAATPRPRQTQRTGQTPTPQQSPTPDATSDVADDDVVRITSNLVQLDVVVTDDKGNQVTDLSAEEFEIFEDGKRQPITNFSYVSVESGATKLTAKAPVDKTAPPVPPARLRPEQVRRTIALVVNDLGTSFESTHHIRRGLKKFVDEEVQPGDLVAVIRASAGMGSLQQFTSDKRVLYAAIERVRWLPSGNGGVSAFAPVGADPSVQADRQIGIKSDSAGSGRDRAGNREQTPTQRSEEFREEVFTIGTLGALNYVLRGMRQLPGRKAIVMFSDGLNITTDDGNNQRIVEGLRRLTDLANRAAVTIYTVDSRGVAFTGLTAADDLAGMSNAAMLDAMSNRSRTLFDSQSGLSHLARQTGGAFIRNTNDLSMGPRRALDDMRGYYLIGYRPDASTFDLDKGRARFHNVSVKVRRSGTNVRARTGFYGFTEEAARPALRTPVEQIVAAITSPFGATDVPLKLTSVFTSEGEKQQYVNSLMHIDVSRFKFTEEADGWRKAVLDVVALTFGESGNVVDQVSRTETVRVRGETYDYVRRHGLLYTMRVPVRKAGAYQLRIAVRDAASERTGSASQFIEVPNLSKDRLALSGIVMRALTPEEASGGGAATTQANAASGGQTQTTEDDTMGNAAVRQFRAGSMVVYFYQIFNPKLDRATTRPQLQTQMRLFRDGEEVHAGTPQSFDAAGQTDMKRLQAGARLRLGANLAPGNYVLQVIVTDLLAKGKTRVATQWIDFEIVDGK